MRARISAVRILLGQSPRLAPALAPAVLGSARPVHPAIPKIVVGTHHKVLTLYFTRVFDAFSKSTGRWISTGTGHEVIYDADTLVDDHSDLRFDDIDVPFVGIHVRRDPRDLLVSAAHYHLVATEPQLHYARARFGGRTYQEHIKSLDSFEEVLLFEIEESAGLNIRSMAAWDYEGSPLAEVRYEDIVGEDGREHFDAAIDPWPLPNREKRLLGRLFEHYSATGPRAKKSGHMRDPRPEQWREHFTPAVTAAFDAAFPDALERLGYQA